MKKTEYLKLALANKLYEKKAWVISAFSIVKEDAEKYKSDSYYGRLVMQPWGFSFIGLNGELEKIDDSISNKPLFTFQDRFTIDSSWFPNVTSPTETVMGNILLNVIAIVPCFGSKMKFRTGKVSVSMIEEEIAKNLKDTPITESDRKNEHYYVDEYVKFCNSLQYITSFSQLSSYASTLKSISSPPGIKEFKAQLLKKYEGKLTDPVELTKFEAELLQFDDAFLKDDPGYKKFLSGKTVDTSRKKLYLNIGADASFNSGLKVTAISNSLEEGWPTDNPEEFTAMLNGLRIGSFARGSETVKGGVSAKILLRAANNYKLLDKDCGTKLGIRRTYNENNISHLVGRYILSGTKSILISNIEEAKPYINKPLIVRSPMYCKLDGDNICRICSGESLYTLPNGIAISLTDISGTILAASLKQMHGKKLSTKHLDVDKVFT